MPLATRRPVGRVESCLPPHAAYPNGAPRLRAIWNTTTTAISTAAMLAATSTIRNPRCRGTSGPTLRMWSDGGRYLDEAEDRPAGYQFLQGHGAHKRNSLEVVGAASGGSALDRPANQSRGIRSRLPPKNGQRMCLEARRKVSRPGLQAIQRALPVAQIQTRLSQLIRN